MILNQRVRSKKRSGLFFVMQSRLFDDPEYRLPGLDHGLRLRNGSRCSFLLSRQLGTLCSSQLVETPAVGIFSVDFSRSICYTTFEVTACVRAPSGIG